MNEPGPHDRKLFRRLAIATTAALLLVLLVITVFGAQFHKLLAETAGAIIGEIKDNLGIVVAASVLCVAAVWILIGLKCWSEWRNERRASRNE